jgi:hypothetical protein
LLDPSARSSTSKLSFPPTMTPCSSFSAFIKWIHNSGEAACLPSCHKCLDGCNGRGLSDDERTTRPQKFCRHQESQTLDQPFQYIHKYHKGEPMKSSHILISHTFHWHDWSILFKVIMHQSQTLECTFA